ncbi:hypothetical protein M3175_20840 [Robertmurraya korlensis]|uniref:hypothetical protein n=1 Tax=Robertmurraya korlensis TaxID=519977 RepID=UPI0020408CA1|nr:hypothetical protein [Robertmurraya korlensis]MCM3603189.1 hypothetical protein [Robertmurraya korlensis]
MVSLTIQWVLLITLTYMVIRLYSLISKSQRRKTLIKSNDGFPSGGTYPFKTISTISSNKISINQNSFKGTIIVGTSYGCDACKSVYPVLSQFKNLFPEYQLLNLSFTRKEDINELINEYSLHPETIALLHIKEMGNFGFEGFPFAYLVSSQGKILQKGLVNTKNDFDLLVSFSETKRVS